MNTIVEHHCIIRMQLLIISSLKRVSRYVSYREASIAIHIVSWGECIVAALIGAQLLSNLPRWGAMLSGMYEPWYLQGRQFGLYLVSQRLLGKLYSFLLFIRSFNLCWSYCIYSFFYIYLFMAFLYVYLITLYFLQSVYILFVFIFTCITNRSHTVE